MKGCTQIQIADVRSDNIKHGLDHNTLKHKEKYQKVNDKHTQEFGGVAVSL